MRTLFQLSQLPFQFSQLVLKEDGSIVKKTGFTGIKIQFRPEAVGIQQLLSSQDLLGTFAL